MDKHLAKSNEAQYENQLDDSETDCYDSSSCSSESEALPWLEHVKSDGSLFYIEWNSNFESFLEDSFDNSYPAEPWSRIRQSDLKLKEKIKNWMKSRKKKVRKSFPLLKLGKNERSSDPFSLQHSKSIYIDVDPSKLAMNSKLTTAEKILGLKLGSLQENYAASDKPCILNIVPNEDGPDVKIGDWIKSVNDIDVNMNNIEDVLKGIPIPSKVKLCIVPPVTQINTRSNFLASKHDNLIKELLGDANAIQNAKLQCQNIPHCLFFLTIESGEASENDDVLFKYPNEDTPLLQLKGMFLTLAHMISDIASPPLLSCSVMVQGEIVHVGFIREENYLMVFSLPQKVASFTEVQHFSTSLAKLLKFQFFSLQQAFQVGNDSGDLDNFLAVFFKHYLSSYSPGTLSETHLLDILPSAHWLPLPNDLKTEVDDILSELESSDFGYKSDGFYGNRRIYNIFGSCLFYKGFLLSSHLPKDDLLDIHLFLHCNHLLELTSTQPVDQIIIWREVFPSRHQNPSSNPDPEFEESHGRWFLLTVVMQYCILAVLLDDDGCALKVEGHPPPEPFYVEEVQNTIFILEDCGITAAVEKLLHFCVYPVVSPDLFYKHNSQNSLTSTFNSNVSIHSSGPNISSEHSTSHSSLVIEKEGAMKLLKCSSNEKLGPADGESDTESSYSNDSNEMESLEKRFRSYSFSTGSTTKSQVSSECSQGDKNFEDKISPQNFSSLPNLNGTAYTSDGICFENSFRMVSGFGNNLFYYLHMDPVEGIFIAPIRPESPSPESLQSSILDCFHRCCLNMRTVFERSLRNAEITKANIVTKYGVNTFLQNAYEQGVLFHCDKTKLKGYNHPAQFWVIGRLFYAPEPREVYVCYHDAVAQDVVETAFRLGFGLSF